MTTMNVPQQQTQAFHQQADMRQAAQHTQTSVTQNQQAAEPTQTSEPPLPPQPPPVLTAGEMRERYLVGGSGPQQTTADTTSAIQDPAQLAQILVPDSAQLQPNQAPPAAAPMSMLPLPPVNAEPATSHISTAMALNIQQALNAQPALNIPPITMTSQPPPANAQPAINPQFISTAPPPQSSQPARQFAPPFDPRPFGKLQRTPTGHWSRLTPPSASPSTVSDGQPASTPSSDAMALRPPPADAQPDADRLLTAMGSPALDRQPASNMQLSFAMAPPPQSVYLPSNRQLPVNPYSLRDPQYRLTHQTYYNLPAYRNREPASNAPRVAIAPLPPSANDGQPAINAPPSNASRVAVAPQPTTVKEQPASNHSSRTTASSARTTHSSANPHSTSNFQPAPDDSSAPTAPPSQLAQLVVKPEPVSDAHQVSDTSSIPKAPDSQPVQPGSNPAPASLVQVAANPHSISNTQLASAAPSTLEAPDLQSAQPDSNPAPAALVQVATNPHPVSNTHPASAAPSMLEAPDPQPAQPASNPAPASIPPPEPAQPDEYPHPIKNAAQWYLDNPPTNTTDRIIKRELCAVYDNLSYTQRNTLRTKFLATISTHQEVRMKQCGTDPVVPYLLAELKNENLRLKFDESDDPRPNAVRLAAARVKNQIELAEAFAKKKEERKMKMEVEGAAVSQPNGVPMGSGQPAGMVRKLQQLNAMNADGTIPTQPVNVPIGSGQYYGAVNGQQLGQVSNGVGTMPAQPSNVPLSSGQYFGPAGGPQPGNDMKPGGWLLAQPSNVSVSSGQHLGGVNGQQ
ncbi:hypothetical protein LTR17_000057 [Elasticomyces elasticus]|nr:hypothetical protein LTR17_000057 [Elasticomyces elasticus]